VLEYVRGFLNILNKDCENIDLKLLESLTLSRLISSLRTFEVMSKQLFLRFPHGYRIINFEAKYCKEPNAFDLN